ncbi:hypothetical protein GDO78_005244 [Eleutherodactylus coqui]|uniref:Uncharacterized protein n=1 Tax=Eleutherodactylus coqui TaxID=57060 RepID=A0A8J6FJH1_ELECQ|nr:hypothetical protein GDO78_005244 [Eleutherodactylus coqui]
MPTCSCLLCFILHYSSQLLSLADFVLVLHACFLWFYTQGYNYCHTPKCFRLELRERRSQKSTCKNVRCWEPLLCYSPHWLTLT